MSKILITGVSGHLGAAVAESLLKKTEAANLTALVRSAEKGEALKARGLNIAIGDYNDYDSLISAFSGIDKLYLVSGTDIPNRAAQQENVVKAATAAGVKHILYTSVQRISDTHPSAIEFIASSHLSTEKAILESGMTYTILQHGLYADLIPMFAGEKLLENKTIFLPAGDGRTAWALRADMAEAGATVLLDETGKYDNQLIEIAGSETVSWQEIADIISGLTGEQISYVSPSVEEFEAALTAGGVPAEYIGLFSGFSKAVAGGEFERVTSDLENILGRKPVTVAEYLKSVYGKK